MVRSEQANTNRDKVRVFACSILHSREGSEGYRRAYLSDARRRRSARRRANWQGRLLALSSPARRWEREAESGQEKERKMEGRGGERKKECVQSGPSLAQWSMGHPSHHLAAHEAHTLSAARDAFCGLREQNAGRRHVPCSLSQAPTAPPPLPGGAPSWMPSPPRRR
jgi:hypothetical protein